MGLFDNNVTANTYVRPRDTLIAPRGSSPSTLQIPKLNPAVAQAPPPAVLPQILGSGNSNNFDTSTLANVAPKLLIPSYNSPQQQALSRQAGMPGGKLNFTC
jgi:hypothetical protein